MQTDKIQSDRQKTNNRQADRKFGAMKVVVFHIQSNLTFSFFKKFNIRNNQHSLIRKGLQKKGVEGKEPEIMTDKK
jgi:hypothetical protein